MKELLTEGRSELRELPLAVEDTYGGLILSEKDYYKSIQEPDMHSLQIKRNLNDSDLQMKLVIPRFLKASMTISTEQNQSTI